MATTTGNSQAGDMPEPQDNAAVVTELIREAIAELNEELDYDHLREVTENTVIFDGDDALDSLSLVALIVDIEARVEESFDTEVVLASEKAMSMANSPYRNVGSLVAFVLGEMAAA